MPDNETNITNRLEELADDFSYLEDWETRYRHIIDMGRGLQPLAEAEKNENTKVRGCVSQVWLVQEFDKVNNQIILRGESDSTLVQGLLSVLIFIYSGSNPEEVLSLPPENVFETLGLIDALTPSRANGLKSMAGRIVEFAKLNA